MIGENIMENCVHEVYEKLMSEDKRKRKATHEHFIKENDNNENKISRVNIVNKKVVTKVEKVEMSPCERFERNMNYENEMEEMWETTFQKIENVATEAASSSVGIQSAIIYGMTCIVLTPIAAIGVCAIGVVKYTFR